jgi:hypothetical protein
VGSVLGLEPLHKGFAGKMVDKSKIDHHFTATVAELKKGFLDTDIVERNVANPPRDEFGGNNIGLQFLRRYLWLVLKLAGLYIAKGIKLCLPKNKHSRVKS